MTIKTHGRMFTDNTVGITQLAIVDGTANQAIVTDGQGVMRFATVGAGGSVGSSVYVEDTFTGDGTTATFTLTTAAPYEESILAFIDGVAQPTASFTLPSTTSITFSPAPGNGAAIRICHLGIASSVANNSITGAHVAMGGDTAGDVLYFNGTDYQRLTIGTTSQHLVVNSAANAPEWASGSIIQTKHVFSSALSNTTARFGIPNSHGIRQVAAFPNTEGTELLTLAITPKSTNNYLRFSASMNYDTSVDNIMGMMCLYRDAIVNALQVGFAGDGSNASSHGGDPGIMRLDHIMQVPSISLQTYKIRVGHSAHSTTGTVYINQSSNAGLGNAAGAVWGGVNQSSLTITEYAA